MNSLNFQPELVAKCILNTTPRSTIKNAMDLSTTSTLFHRIINSETFFKGLVDLVEANHFLLKGNWSCFKDRYFELRGACLFKTDDFPGAIFGDALVSEEGVEVFSFFHDICNFKLNEVSEFNQIVIPENLRIPPKPTSQDSPFVARSEKYLAINDKTDSSVYIYTPDGSECLNRLDLSGEIYQLTIIDNMLYVLESGGRFYSLIVYNLELTDC